MKKIMAILLSLALLLGCAAGLAEDTEKTIFGTIRVNGEFTLQGILPEGYKVVPFLLSDDAIFSRLLSDDSTRPEAILSIAYDETYSDVDRLNDLDDDALAILEKTFTDTDPYASITYDETAYGTRLMLVRTLSDNYDYLDILSIYKGYFVEFVMTPGKGAEEQRLTDEMVEYCNTFLSELDFVPGTVERKVDLKGKTYEVLVDSFDADAKTLDVTLLEPITLTAGQVYLINEGDTIKIGTEDVEIGTLVYEGDNAIINDEYYIDINEDGLFNVKLYESTVMTEIKKMTVSIGDNLVFVEGIDPEYGDPLDEVKELTAADLFAALTAAKDGGIGFDSQNVKMTFDDNGEPTTVERFYAPWQ